VIPESVEKWLVYAGNSVRFKTE